MNFSELIKSRQSTLYFDTNYKISDKDFLEILELTRFTPSGYNAQPWEFLIIKDLDRLKKIHEIALEQDKVLEAGSVVIVLGNVAFGRTETERILSDWAKFREADENRLNGLRSSLLKKRDDWKEREMMLRNTSLACMSFLLAAESLGFSTCPMMGFRQLDLKKFLALPADILPVMMIALGKQDPKRIEPRRLPRKTSENIAHFEHYKS